MNDIDKIRTELLARVVTMDQPREILKTTELKKLYGEIPKLAAEKRGEFGRQINELKQALETKIAEIESAKEDEAVESLDITAPMDINAVQPQLMAADNGSIHPITTEIANIADIFTRMGFDVIESRQLDDDFHMFTSLNFPPNHPARDGYDTFWTDDGFVSPAHTSTMQNRILRDGRAKLEAGGQIAGVSIGRVFRNEDADVTHDHTFHQCEGIFVSTTTTLGQMLGVLQSFFETYYGQELKIKTQPGYFPFTEPSLEFAIEKPKTLGGKGGEWLEMLGCGMIHPNVLKAADIDPKKYRGFAWGGGVERLVMLKYGIEDLRHFESGKLAFLREFK